VVSWHSKTTAPPVNDAPNRRHSSSHNGDVSPTGGQPAAQNLPDKRTPSGLSRSSHRQPSPTIWGGGTSHWPSVHVSPAAHAVPQLPQLLTSLCTLVQTTPSSPTQQSLTQSLRSSTHPGAMRRSVCGMRRPMSKCCVPLWHGRYASSSQVLAIISPHAATNANPSPATTPTTGGRSTAVSDVARRPHHSLLPGAISPSVDVTIFHFPDLSPFLCGRSVTTRSTGSGRLVPAAGVARLIGRRRVGGAARGPPHSSGSRLLIAAHCGRRVELEWQHRPNPALEPSKEGSGP
jgi:hypothetical protein